jgi:hypothetical protein
MGAGHTFMGRGTRVGAGGGVVAMTTIGVEAARAVAWTRSRRPSGHQRH